MTHPQSMTYGVNRPKYLAGDYSVSFTRIYALWPRRVYLQWNLTGATSTTGYSFKLERSESPEGPWENLTGATPVVDHFFYVDDAFTAEHDDTAPGLFSIRNILYYRITCTYTGGAPAVTAIGQLGGEVDQRRAGVIRKLRRDANVMLQKGNGTEVAILKRKWWGESCSCRSATGQVTRSHCTYCHGTGIVSGYWAPVYTFGSRTESSPTEQVASSGVAEVSTLQAIIPYIPEVRPRDILVFLRDNRRYIVEGTWNTSIQTSLVHQELTLSEIATSSVEYDMKVDPWRSPEWF